MERRLLDAYDHMTMPDDCTRRIEARLQTELESRKDGQYTKVVSPHSSRRGGWMAAAACLLLVLFVGIAGFRIWMTGTVVEEVPTELAADYSAATDIPSAQVEAFAAEIRQNLLEQDWEAFSQKVQYPISILVRGIGNDADVQEIHISSDGNAMVQLLHRETVNSSFLEEIRREECAGMFCNDQGICMADGRIWINEIDGKLKITAINGILADTTDPQDFAFKLGPDGYVMTEYAGQEAVIAIPASTAERKVTAIGTGQPVITNGGNQVEVVWIPATVQSVQKDAFANCPALKAVYFEGDAPEEVEGVFEGSNNVTVYFQGGKKGWGDTWCGRETREYSHHISLGTVTVQDRIPAQFEAILSGEPVDYYDNRGAITVQEYCTALWADAAANAFTLADLDRDGVCELIFSVQDAEGVLLGYLVVRQDGEAICGYTIRGRDLRKDGTFYSYTAKENSRLRFQDETSFFVESTDFSQQDKPLAQWHVYPCQAPFLVLESYRYASETGFSTHPGSPYYYLGTLLSGEAEWSTVQPWLAQQSVYVEEGGSFHAFDPDAPGCLMYGTLTGAGEQKKLTALGYYICDETGEYRAEVLDLDQPDPVYTVEVPPDDRGRVVESPEALQDYLGTDFYGSEISRDVQQIVELLDSFVHRYTDQDTEGMQAYMADPTEDLSVYPFTGEVSILSYGILPDAAIAVGESWHTSVELLESGDLGSRYCLTAVLVKQTDGWKIHSCSLEKQ